MIAWGMSFAKVQFSHSDLHLPLLLNGILDFIEFTKANNDMAVDHRRYYRQHATDSIKTEAASDLNTFRSPDDWQRAYLPI